MQRRHRQERSKRFPTALSAIGGLLLLVAIVRLPFWHRPASVAEPAVGDSVCLAPTHVAPFAASDETPNASANALAMALLLDGAAQHWHVP